MTDAKGPGDGYVSMRGIVSITIYLIVLALLTFVVIVFKWPECDLTCKDVAGTSTAGDTNPGTNSNSNGNANANANAGSPNTNSGATNNAAGTTPSGSTLPTSPAGGGAAGGTEQTRADIDSVEPTSGSINGNTQVMIKGKGFLDGDVVKFDGVTARVTRVSDESLSLRTPCHEEGVVDIAIYRKGKEKADNDLSNSYTYTCPAPSGRALFILIIFAGALGGIIHATRSLWWYVGHRALYWSWGLMYILLPFIGAAMALVFYLIIIAGFLPNAPSRNVALFVLATAALVGMFSQQAALKLTDIANAFFTKPGPGSESKPQKSLPANSGDAA